MADLERELDERRKAEANGRNRSRGSDDFEINPPVRRVSRRRLPIWTDLPGLLGSQEPRLRSRQPLKSSATLQLVDAETTTSLVDVNHPYAK